jgi:hypothetical protein
MQFTDTRQIIDKATAATQEPEVFYALDRFADG